MREPSFDEYLRLVLSRTFKFWQHGEAALGLVITYAVPGLLWLLGGGLIALSWTWEGATAISLVGYFLVLLLVVSPYRIWRDERLMKNTHKEELAQLQRAARGVTLAEVQTLVQAEAEHVRADLNVSRTYERFTLGTYGEAMVTIEQSGGAATLSNLLAVIHRSVEAGAMIQLVAEGQPGNLAVSVGADLTGRILDTTGSDSIILDQMGTRLRCELVDSSGVLEFDEKIIPPL